MNTERNKSCAFSGSKPENLDFNEEEIKTWLKKMIHRAIEDGYTDFFTGMKKGADLWAAEEVIKQKKEGLDIRLYAACAYQGVDNAWINEWKTSFRYVLYNADEVIIVSKKAGNRAYLMRDAFLVDNSSRLISVYGGEGGSTYIMMKYAKDCGVEVVALTESYRSTGIE